MLPKVSCTIRKFFYTSSPSPNQREIHCILAQISRTEEKKLFVGFIRHMLECHKLTPSSYLLITISRSSFKLLCQGEGLPWTFANELNGLAIPVAGSFQNSIPELSEFSLKKQITCPFF